MSTRPRDAAAQIVANNWRIRRRLPRITARALAQGAITMNNTPMDNIMTCPRNCVSAFQDLRYGKGRRVHTLVKDGPCCTVCGGRKRPGTAAVATRRHL